MKRLFKSFIAACWLYAQVYMAELGTPANPGVYD